MKIFECKDTEHGRPHYVIASDMKKAIDLFTEKNNSIPPEVVRDIAADGGRLIMQSESEKIWQFVDNWLIGNTNIDPDKLLVLKKDLEKHLDQGCE